MKYTEKEVLQFVEENDVKFVKLMFCDIFGSLKTISVIAGETLDFSLTLIRWRFFHGDRSTAG